MASKAFRRMNWIFRKRADLKCHFDYLWRVWWEGMPPSEPVGYKTPNQAIDSAMRAEKKPKRDNIPQGEDKK